MTLKNVNNELETSKKELYDIHEEVYSFYKKVNK